VGQALTRTLKGGKKPSLKEVWYLGKKGLQANTRLLEREFKRGPKRSHDTRGQSCQP